MIKIHIPGFGDLQIEHLVLDYNGTLACGGTLLDNVAPLLEQLEAQLQIHILTADTFGTVRKMFSTTPYTVSVLTTGNEAEEKRRYVRELGGTSSVCIGNGRNDQRMLREAALGIAVIQEEGASLRALLNADIVCTDIIAALELLLSPQRLQATLRC